VESLAVSGCGQSQHEQTGHPSKFLMPESNKFHIEGNKFNTESNIGIVPFAHVAIDHSHSQQPVPKGFPLFKRCEWLMVNCNLDKGVPIVISDDVGKPLLEI